MDEVIVNKIAKVIEEWNPLGEKTNSIEGLEGYRYEAMDIISSSKILSSSQSVKESIFKVLTQAFHIELDDAQLSKTAEKIKSLIAETK